MDVVSAEVSARRKGFLDRVFPLRHWLGAQASGGIEMGQAKTRLICTVVGVGGFAVMSPLAALPNGIIATAIVFPLYALAYLILVYKRPAPTHTRRGFAILMDNLVGTFVAYFGGGFAVYVGFLFLTTVGWGLRFGRPYLFLATAIAICGMVWNLVASPYWQEQSLFGITIILGLIASTVNASILLGRIAGGNRLLAEKIEEVLQLAWQDQLTKLPNRPYFRERLAQMLAAAARNGRQVALLLFDIDGFKAVNDTHGHLFGSRALVEAAAVIRQSARETDVVSRFGGDEFALVLPDTGGDGAYAVGERIRERIAAHRFLAGDGLDIHLTVSIGVATLPDVAASAEELMHAADKAMYMVKDAGKNGIQAAIAPADN